jgi:thiamine pyrophosphokinase
VLRFYSYLGKTLKKCIILAKGRSPQKAVFQSLEKHNFSTLICADGGANLAKKLELIPDYIIGDLDSVKASTLNFFKKKSKIVELKRQNDTDVEKCIKFAIKNEFEEAVLLGVTGNRLDHTFCNLGIVIKFFKKIKLKLIAEESLLIPYKGSVELKTFPGEIISLYGFDKKTRITSRGLKYPLKKDALPFGERESTSNIAKSDRIKLEIEGGIIFIIRNLRTAKFSGLF